MKNFKGKTKSLAIASIMMMSIFGTTSSYAVDCEAQFQFINKWKAKNNGNTCEIKVRKVAIVGDLGAWDENITNKKIMYGKTHSTSGRTLNKLSRGKTGSFTLHFDQKCHVGGNWLARTHGPFNYKCEWVYPYNIFKFTVQR